MTTIAAATSTVTAAFLASLVEVVEAFTIVLAVGITCGWRSALTGALTALAVLTVTVAVLGPLLTLIPLGLLQFVIGTLLILFGLRWLRKAILRSAGRIPLHDETAIFAREMDALERQKAARRADWLAGLAAFKAVLLEGTEVVFIVIAVGTTHGSTLPAAMGALAAVALVFVIGLAAHRPLARVPENTLKFTVGLMLSAFGVFWTGEGLGADWPGGDLAFLGLFAVFLAASLVAVAALRGPAVGAVR